MENWQDVDTVSSLSGKDVADHTQETRLIPQGVASGPITKKGSLISVMLWESQSTGDTPRDGLQRKKLQLTEPIA